MSVRNTVNNTGTVPVYHTFEIDDSTIKYDATKMNGSSQVGLAVTFSGNNTVQLVGDGEAVVGKLISVDSDNFCTVQTAGVMTLPGGSGATLTRGTKIVGDLGASSAEGYIRTAASGTATELVVGVGQIWDASEATAVVVKL